MCALAAIASLCRKCTLMLLHLPSAVWLQACIHVLQIPYYFSSWHINFRQWDPISKCSCGRLQSINTINSCGFVESLRSLLNWCVGSLRKKKKTDDKGENDTVDKGVDDTDSDTDFSNDLDMGSWLMAPFRQTDPSRSRVHLGGSSEGL